MTRIVMFAAKVLPGGTIPIDKDVRTKLEVGDGSYVQVTLQKLDLFRSSMHRFNLPRSIKRSLVAQQMSTTMFQQK